MKMIRSMARESFLGNQVTYIKGLTPMMSGQGMGRCTLLMELYTKVTGLEGCRKELELLFLMMGLHCKGTSIIIYSMERTSHRVVSKSS